MMLSLQRRRLPAITPYLREQLRESFSLVSQGAESLSVDQVSSFLQQLGHSGDFPGSRFSLPGGPQTKLADMSPDDTACFEDLCDYVALCTLEYTGRLVLVHRSSHRAS